MKRETPKQNISSNEGKEVYGEVGTNHYTRQNATSTEADSNTLTDNAILTATYKINANFAGVKTPLIDIVFPPKEMNSGLSDIVYINKRGILTNSMSENPEAFWISSYKYTDRTYTEAKVLISANFGGSGFDDRLFVVDKINGKVVTKEIPCKNQSSNGACDIDSN